MNKKEAKKLVQAGTHQIHNDCENLELLREFFYNMLPKGYAYYSMDFICDEPFEHLKTIKLSEITEKPNEWLGSEMECFDEINNKWQCCFGRKYRLKPKPNFDEEIKVLQEKAKQHGMKAIITFEKL